MAALVQSDAIDTYQIQALVSIKQEDCDLVKALRPVLRDSYWQDRMTEVWPRAAAESTAASLLMKVQQELTGDAASVERGWASLARSWSKWHETLRPGILAPVISAAAKAVSTAAQEVASSDVTPESQKTAELWRSRAAWFADRGLADEQPLMNAAAQTLEEWLQKSTAILRLSEGMALLAQWSSDTVASEQAASAAACLTAISSCRGLQCNSADATLIRQALEELETEESSELHADLALALIDVLPDAHPQRHAWAKTRLSFKMIQVAADISGVDPAKASEEQKAIVTKAWAEWAAMPGTSLTDDSPSLVAALDEVKSWEESQLSRARDASHIAASATISALEAAAGGGEGGESWKARLGLEAGWDVVEREALHHLLPSRGTPVHKRLEDLFSAADEAAKNIPASDDRRAELMTRLDAAKSTARITATESYLLSVILNEKPDRQGAKIRRRMEQMSKPPEVSPEFLLPQLWVRVMATVAQ